MCGYPWGPGLACNPGMYPDWESNQRLFGSQAGTQFTEPHQPGKTKDFYISIFCTCCCFCMESSPRPTLFIDVCQAYEHQSEQDVWNGRTRISKNLLLL